MNRCPRQPASVHTWLAQHWYSAAVADVQIQTVESLTERLHKSLAIGSITLISLNVYASDGEVE